VSLSDSMDAMRAKRMLLEELIEHPERLGPDFQPIKRLDDDTVVGYKATGRGQQGTELDSTLALLESAQGLGLVERLDWAFRCHAFDVMVERGPDVELYITPEPETYGGACPPRLAAAFGRGKRQLKVAAEVPADAFADPARTVSGVAEYRGWGWRVVADDVSEVPGAVDVLERLRPEVVKLDLARPGRTGTPSAGEAAMLEWARSAGAIVMAVNVDTEVGRAAAVQAGATIARGRLLGPPGPLPV